MGLLVAYPQNNSTSNEDHELDPFHFEVEAEAEGVLWPMESEILGSSSCEEIGGEYRADGRWNDQVDLLKTTIEKLIARLDFVLYKM